MAAMVGMPLLDRRQAALIDQLLELLQAESLKLDRRAAFRASHGVIGLLRGPAQGRSARDDRKRTAIVTGAGKRVGADIRAR